MLYWTVMSTYKNKKPSCRLSGTTVPPISKGHSGRGKQAISKSKYMYSLAMVTLLHRTLQSTLGYAMVIRRTWVIGCRQQLCIQNCGQTAADKDSYYWQHIETHHIALSNTTIAGQLRCTSHNTRVTNDDDDDDRQTDRRHIGSQRLDLTVGQ